MRGQDVVARLGGDEFAVLQTDADGPESTAILAQRLISVMQEPFEVGGQIINTSASIGISTAAAGDIDADQMIRQSDMSLFRAKHDGRSTFCFHAEEMDREVRERLALGRDLHQAICNDEFFLEFQPQIDLRKGRVAGLEALLRWRHPQRGLIPPNRFIPIAEKTGLIVPLGEWVLRRACATATRLQEETGQALVMAVNVSAVQMRVPDFAATVLSILRESGAAPEALELELTESVLMQRTPQVESTLEQLHQGGVRVSVDDFGTGYSSMAYLRQFAVDKLKIDRSFLAEVETNAGDAAIVSAIIALGNKLGLQVLAEGVERRQQIEFLRRNGCDRAQGYYFSRPVPADDLADLLRSTWHKIDVGQPGRVHGAATGATARVEVSP